MLRTSTRGAASRRRPGWRHLTGLGVALAVVAAACGGGGDDGGDDALAGPGDDDEADAEDGGAGDEATTGDPIKVGLLLPTTGTVAANGEEALEGWELFWEQNGNTVAGREIVSVHEDTAGDPTTALQKLEVLQEREDVDMVVGPLLANIGLAVGDVLSQEGVPHFSPVQCANDLTQDLATDTFARIGGLACGTTSHPYGQWAADQGFERIATICTDFTFGHETCGGFADTFTDEGGEIIEQLWHPIGNEDFSTFVSQLRDADPDAVFAQPVGAEAIRFLQAWNDFGMRDSGIELLMGFVPTDQSNLRGLDDPALVEGLVSAGHYAEGREEPGTEEFVADFEEEFGKIPAFYSAGTFTAAQWIAEAIEAVDGNVEDTEAFMEAVRSIELEDSPLGPQQLDEFGNPDTNVYIRELVVRDDGQVWNVVTDQFDMVSQFWTYEPQEYIDQPPYDRDFQGLDN